MDGWYISARSMKLSIKVNIPASAELQKDVEGNTAGAVGLTGEGITELTENQKR